MRTVYRERFLSRIDRSGGTNSCWEWRGTFFANGYPAFWMEGKQHLAHRLSYELLTGKKLKNFACHTCDNPACCNPEHIFDGTQKDNMRDMVKKGRKVVKAIEKRPVKLSEAEVRKIFDDPRSSRKVAADFDICGRMVLNIKNGVSWKHLNLREV